MDSRLLAFSGTVYVPTSRASALSVIKSDALGLFNGYTATPGEGGWVHKDTTNIEGVTVVKVWSEDKNSITRWIVESSKVLRDYGEKSMLFEVSDSGKELSAGLT